MIQTLFDGLMIGGVYAIIALGLTLIFGVMRVINMTHGEFVMIGMFTSYFMFQKLGLDPFIGILITAPVCFCIGYFLYSAFVSKAQKAGEENTLLLTAGASILLVNVAALPYFLGPNFSRLTGESLYWENRIWTIGGINFNASLLTGFFLTALLIFLLSVFLKKTNTGLAMRAAAQQPMAARIVGINVPFISGITFGLGAVFAGIAGSVLSTTYPIYASIGALFLVKAFVIVVLGGMGSIPGAALGGLVLGVTESLGATYIPGGTAYRDVFGLVIFLLVLLYRPQGLFGRRI
ncbi:branched-chain amino acid ABC transporter permease [Pollutimonas harenae]|uniref:Branched-chain amino acid ABC transporter permease n=1 Tax=Pollutimonas harenae TaxID=657015 RepID=A0A853H1C2_9BURK|nr:branched-chain amino acid ABC transporter permease [Pollutimonas harenae]NYT84373.1 branched-chain amino acid ABC transporter permease [Pollutimonas harenae]TEA73226.1 branched-chain amino acid ABC transporter permease [Pollutimonas harenae]